MAIVRLWKLYNNLWKMDRISKALCVKSDESFA